MNLSRGSGKFRVGLGDGLGIGATTAFRRCLGGHHVRRRRRRASLPSFVAAGGGPAGRGGDIGRLASLLRNGGWPEGWGGDRPLVCQRKWPSPPAGGGRGFGRDAVPPCGAPRVGIRRSCRPRASVADAHLVPGTSLYGPCLMRARETSRTTPMPFREKGGPRWCDRQRRAPQKRSSL